MTRRESLKDLVEAAGGEYIRLCGNKALVRWDAGTVRLESRDSLVQAADALDAYEQIAAQAQR